MDDEDDDVVCLGTPLEELSEGDVQTRKAPRVEDQIVTDKQGRRRFHGAFTGGFSAGYFNSVGTKEGWTPSTFVSSRGQRSEAQHSKPQDFMDEEDLEAFGISPQGIRTSADFNTSKPVKRKRVTDPSGPIPGTPVLEELLRPARETIGMKLLRRLGWRPGQGVGPRVSRRQKLSDKREKRRMLASQGAAAKGSGGASDSEEGSDDSEDEALKDVTFAPSDVPELSMVQPKTDQFGLGYTPLSRASVLGGHVNLFDPAPLALTEKKKKLLIKGQAFGVGAFEEEDEDIYATEDMSNYDFGEEKDAKDKGQGRKEQQNMVMLGLIKAIDGFKLGSQPAEQSKVHPPPALPPDFIPHHQPRRLRFERRESELRGLGRHTMTAEQRAHAIAEKPKATVEIRSGVKGQNQQQQQPTASPKDSQKVLDTSEVDKLYEEFKNSDKKLSSDFKPFARNPEKQKRYELFLRMKDKGQKDRFYLAQPRSMTEWEREREVQEFTRAAKLFQPLTSSMATRFVTAATSDADPSLKDGLNIDIPKAESKEGKEGLLDPIAPGDERTAAARSGMFGRLTQNVEEWHPDNLLCRRFNVPNPYPDSSFVGVRKAKKEKLSLFSSFHTDPEETAGLRSSHSRKEHDSREERDQQQEEMVQEGEEGQLQDRPEDYGLKVPIDGPPTMDLFRAIFQDSDSDSEEEKSNSSSPKTDGKVAHHSLSSSSSYSAATPDFSVTNSNTHEEASGSSTEKSQTFGNAEAAPTISTTPAMAPHPGQRRTRVSRFEPLKEDVVNQTKEPQKPANQPEDISMHTFIPRKRDAPANKSIPPVTQGIFANVDLVALNSYRNQEPSESNKEVKRVWPEAVTKLVQEKTTNDDASSSSTDSEDAYGPPVPSHLKNRAQVIQSTPPITRITRPVGEAAARQQDTGWVERETGNSKSSTKKHKHKARSKSKKEKKKKKDKKSKRHKEKKKKKGRKSSSRRRKSNSSSSNSSKSESSSSDSD